MKLSIFVKYPQCYMASENQILKQDILIRLKKGDESALSLLYDLYWEQLFIAAYNLLKDRGACEDIIQEIYISLWNRRESLQIKSTIKSYLYSAVVYKTYDHFRRNSKMRKVELKEEFDKRIHSATPESNLIYNELVEFFETSIDTLPEKCKEIFLLNKYEGYQHKEIAEFLGLSPKTVENQIGKAYIILKRLLKIYIIYFILFNTIF